MRKAFDNFLDSEVYAELAAKVDRAGSNEPYRYECSNCGEEVCLVLFKTPYFRHRSGNNNIDCEYYIGQHESINTNENDRKSKNERAEFYFDNNINIFYLGLRFNNTEIEDYEKHSIYFELRANYNEEPFYKIKIDRNKFSPDDLFMISINKFSNNYFLSNTFSKKKRKYEVFKNDKNAPTFFKILGNDCKFKAKLVRSSTLYTNVLYFAVYQNSNVNDKKLPDGIAIDKCFEFETMNKKFFGQILSIKEKNNSVESYLSSYGYHLETSEVLTVMWPPSSIKDEQVYINTDYIFLYLTFDLQAHGNINVNARNIKKISEKISKVDINSKTKVHNKNTDLVFEKYIQKNNNYDKLSIKKETKDIFKVTDDNGFFFFNRFGVSPLKKGMMIYLTPRAKIRHYISGYLDYYIEPFKHTEFTGEPLIKEILAYYKRMEPFYWKDFDLNEISNTAFQYLKKCEKDGLINSVIKRFIKEGRI